MTWFIVVAAFCTAALAVVAVTTTPREIRALSGTTWAVPVPVTVICPGLAVDPTADTVCLPGPANRRYAWLAARAIKMAMTSVVRTRLFVHSVGNVFHFWYILRSASIMLGVRTTCTGDRTGARRRLRASAREEHLPFRTLSSSSDEVGLNSRGGVGVRLDLYAGVAVLLQNVFDDPWAPEINFEQFLSGP